MANPWNIFDRVEFLLECFIASFDERRAEPVDRALVSVV